MRRGARLGLGRVWQAEAGAGWIGSPLSLAGQAGPAPPPHAVLRAQPSDVGLLARPISPLAQSGSRSLAPHFTLMIFFVRNDRSASLVENMLNRLRATSRGARRRTLPSNRHPTPSRGVAAAAITCANAVALHNPTGDLVTAIGRQLGATKVLASAFSQLSAAQADCAIGLRGVRPATGGASRGAPGASAGQTSRGLPFLRTGHSS